MIKIDLPKRIAGLTYTQAELEYYAGIISFRDFEKYVFVWTWSAPRFAGTAGMLQELCNTIHGYDFVKRRINRVRNWAGFKPYYKD